MENHDLFADADRGATFSRCETYRYLLWRRWSAEPPAVFVMLNPSTADADRNDPTVERCERRARAGGYGGVVVANIFALRSTDPNALYVAADPVGPDNDEAIVTACSGAGIVVCAWGVHAAFRGRGDAVRGMLAAAGVRPHHLGLTKAGFPRHPLYVGYSTKPIVWEEGSAA